MCGSRAECRLSFTRTATMNKRGGNKKNGRVKGQGRTRVPAASVVPRGDSRPTPFTYVPVLSRHVRLTYPGAFLITEAAANAGAQKIFRLNGPFDVDTTLGSTSTPGFAELSAMFSSCRVWSTSVRVEATASGGSAGSVANIIMYPNANNTFLTNPASWAVEPYSVKRAVRADSAGGGRNFVTLVKRYDMPSVFRITKNQFLSDADYASVVSTTPAKQAYLAISVYAVGSATVVTATGIAYFQMEVEFFNPIQLSS